MPIDRTHLTDRQADDFATISDINDVYHAVNNLKSFSSDDSQDDLFVNRGSVEAGDRGIKFMLTSSSWMRMFWDNASNMFRFINQGGTLQKIAIANGTAATHGVTKGQLDSAINALQLEVTGAIKMYAGTAAPSGYLLCDGTQISRATYASLFAVIGTTYGNGNGSSTFHLPDLRGRVAMGLDNMGGVTAGRVTSASAGGANADNLGGTGGSETHVLTDAELPSSIKQPGGTTFGLTSSGSPLGWGQLKSPTLGNDDPFSITSPWLALNAIIKT